MTSRDKHKEAFKKANEEVNEEQAFLQDQLQYAVKILMNFFAAPHIQFIVLLIRN